jgi:tryptophanyl-tRNA synthetase
MSKSADSLAGSILILEDLAGVSRKIKRAVTDAENEVRYDPVAKPGVSNLLSILAAATDRTPEACAEGYRQYGPLKSDTADAVVALLEPIQARYRELEADPAATTAILDAGADQARSIAGPTLERAHRNLGLLAAG